MKKTVLIIFTLFVSGFFLFQKSDTDDKKDTFTFEDTSAKADERKKRESSLENKLKERAVKKELSTEELSAYFNKVDNDWNVKMKAFIIDELQLKDDDYQDYLKMREGYAEDKSEAFIRFHKEQAKRNGEGHTFSPSRDLSLDELKVKEEYRTLLKNRIGKEHYARYLEVLDKFNRNLRLTEDSGLPFVEIEL